MNFAKLLRSVIPEKDFVGRYGGDEFIAVIYHTSEAEIKVILKSLYRERDRLNSYENQIPIDYAADGHYPPMICQVQCRCYWMRQMLICIKIKSYARNIISFQLRVVESS